MARGIFRRIQRGVRRAVRRATRALPGPENERRKQRRESARQGFTLSGQRKYAEAAEIFTRLAAESLQYNELFLAQLDCRQACMLWLRAKQPANALEQARTILRIRSDRGLLGSLETVNDLRRLAGEFHLAGYDREAETFLKELNERLAALGLSLVEASAADPVPEAASSAGKLPAACPQCGGRLPRASGEDEIECYYCGSIVRAE